MHRSHKRPGVRAAVVAVVFFVIIILGSIVNFARPLPAVHADNKPITTDLGTTNMQWPGVGEAAIGADGFGLLDQTQTQTPLPTASIAKVITSLAVLEKKPLNPGENGPSLTISQSDVDLYNKYAAEDGSRVLVQVGEQISERQIIEALMLPSANNLADSAAVWTFGSVDNYISYANQMLGRLGLTHTTVSGDASGFLPGTVSTPADLVKLGALVLQNPVLTKVVAEPQATLPVAGTVYNVDSMLGTDGIIGIKTGNTDQAGGCFLFAATHQMSPTQTVTIVGAVMGAPDLQSALNDAVPMLESAKDNLDLTTFAHAGDTIGTYTLPWGKTINAVAQHDVTAVTWKGKQATPTVTLNNLKGIQQKDSRVGTISVDKGTLEASSPVVLQQIMPAPSAAWRIFRNPFTS
jgi:D-alanyl-D-alanine carboxypeptidase (penicillin-binding protein 5/6)